MLVISSKEFRDNQAAYFDRADEGVEILVQRGKNKAYKIIPIQDDDTLMTKEEFFAKLDRSIQDIEEGKGIVLKSKEEFDKFFENL